MDRLFLKYVTVLLLAIFIVYSANNLISAEETVGDRDQRYATTQEILFALVEPKLEKIIHDKYSKEMVWNVFDVKEVAFVMDHKNNEAWFKMDLFIAVGDPEDAKIDSISLKVDAPNIGGEHTKSNGEIKDITVDLIKYGSSN